MNYIGSKKSLLTFLETSIYQITGKSDLTFLDLFAGTGIVGQHFKKNGHPVIANDLQYYSYVLNKNYIENNKPLTFKDLENEIVILSTIPIPKKHYYICDYLDKIPAVEGFIYNNYCVGGTKNSTVERQYFSDENGKKVDAIRQKIEVWKEQNLINNSEYYFLLATLIENIDKVANTASVYGAFLKKLKPSAQKKFSMQPAHFLCDAQNHQVFKEDAEQLIKTIKGDILYLDPPYNHRQYAPNYHLLETIAKYDTPELKGKTGLRDYSTQKSKFSQKNEVLQSFENLIDAAVNLAQVKYIFLSYNNEGLMLAEDVAKIMSKKGQYGVFTKEYNRFKADKDISRTHKAASVTEYLHYVIVG